MRASVEVITPTKAQLYLERNSSNRNVSWGNVEKYADEMRAGRWQLNGEAIIFDEAGNLLNGQHRLLAVIQSGQPLETLTVRGIEAEAFSTMDGGKPRSLADLLSIDGHKYEKTMAGIARYAYCYATRGVLSQATSRGELYDFARDRPYISEVAALTKTKAGRFSSVPVASVAYLANDGREYDGKLDAFLTALGTGEGMRRGDPRLTLREWMIEAAQRRDKTSGVTSFAAVARAWNAWAEGKSLTVIKNISGPTARSLPIIGYRQERYPDVRVIDERRAESARLGLRQGVERPQLMAAE